MRLLVLLMTLLLLNGCAPPPGQTPPTPVHQTPASETEAVQALFQSALHKLRNNDTEGGLADLKKAAELYPENPDIVEAYLVVAMRMRKLGRVEDGLKVVDLALEFQPEKAHFWQAKGSFLFAAQKPEEARQALVKAGELAPEDPNIPYDMGWQASQNEATHEQALKDYSRALEIDPNLQRAWANRGALHSKMGHYKEASEDLDQALELEPNDSVALYEKASVLVKLDQKNEARKYAQRVVELNQNPQAVALAKLLLSE